MHHRPTTPAGTVDFSALDNLHGVLRTISSWMAAFETLPPLAPMGFTYPVFAQLSHCALSLFRLTVLRDPAWDRAAVRRTADVFDIVDRLAARLEALPALAGLVIDRNEDNIFMTHARFMRAMRTSLEMEVAAMDAEVAKACAEDSQVPCLYQGENSVARSAAGEATSGGGSSGVSSGPCASTIGIPDDLAMNLVDDQWLVDMFRPWDGAL